MDGAGEKRMCREFEALNCFLKLSSSSSGFSRRPGWLATLRVAPFAFYLGMFNISFPYRELYANARSTKTTGEQDGCRRERDETGKTETRASIINGDRPLGFSTSGN